MTTLPETRGLPCPIMTQQKSSTQLTIISYKTMVEEYIQSQLKEKLVIGGKDFTYPGCIEIMGPFNGKFDIDEKDITDEVKGWTDDKILTAIRENDNSIILVLPQLVNFQRLKMIRSICEKEQQKLIDQGFIAKMYYTCSVELIFLYILNKK